MGLIYEKRGAKGGKLQFVFGFTHIPAAQTRSAFSKIGNLRQCRLSLPPQLSGMQQHARDQQKIENSGDSPMDQEAIEEGLSPKRQPA